MRKIINVDTTDGLILKVTYNNGQTIAYDVSPLINRGGEFAKLADYNQFKQVKIGPRGRSLEWPGQLDLCADAIWLKATGEIESYDDKAS